MLHRQTKRLNGSSEDTGCGIAYSLKSNATGNQTTTRQSSIINSKKVKAPVSQSLPTNECCKPRASAAITLKPFKVSTNDVLFDSGIDSNQKTAMTGSGWNVDAERNFQHLLIQAFVAKLNSIEAVTIKPWFLAIKTASSHRVEQLVGGADPLIPSK
jgi:hypothetical protein